MVSNWGHAVQLGQSPPSPKGTLCTAHGGDDAAPGSSEGADALLAERLVSLLGRRLCVQDRVAIAWMLENCENVHPVTLPPPSAMQQQ